MRPLVICSVIAASTLLAGAPTAAQAAWCAMLRNGGTNCGFATIAQCQAAISGVGGVCNQDPASARTEPGRAPPDRRKQEAAPRRPEPARAAAPQQPTDFAGARALIMQGQYEAGIRAMRALNFDDHPEVAAHLGLAYHRLKRLDEAKSWYERALFGNPEHKLALSLYGALRAETGDLDGARAALERLRTLCGGTACDEYQVVLSAIAANLPR